MTDSSSAASKDETCPSGFDIHTKIDFLADLPLYYDEKPYYLHASDSAGDYLDQIKITNVRWDTQPVVVHSMRDNTDISLENNGFAYVRSESKYLPYAGMGLETVQDYRRESEDLLRSMFDAELVRCYDFKVRANWSLMSSDSR
ncbi:hypothetical protein QIS74_09367 [Colletotrichum tabaci]|uniref:Uncharacterized protein n=1 Tax=Colletotrichum tabaci TaxID=1209068 RepID=A0AAV9T708_9PEZI